MLARAVMNGESTDADVVAGDVPVAVRCWRRAAPPSTRRRSSTASLDVADRGEQVRSQFRGAIVESLTELLLRPAPSRPRRRGAVRRERRILFDGVRAEIHPYDVTVEIDGAAAAVDCKWGARGISADVLHQLDDARTHAARRRRAARARRSSCSTAAPVVRRPPRAPDRAPRAGPGSSAWRRSMSWRSRDRDGNVPVAGPTVRRDPGPRGDATASGSTRPAPMACSGRPA